MAAHGSTYCLQAYGTLQVSHMIVFLHLVRQRVHGRRLSLGRHVAFFSFFSLNSIYVDSHSFACLGIYPSVLSFLIAFGSCRSGCLLFRLGSMLSTAVTFVSIWIRVDRAI